MPATKQRKGFAMIMAIFVIFLVAAGGALILGKASMASKSVGDNYLRAQAELLAESATEFALMQARNADTAAGQCLNDLDITVNDAGGSPMFTINVDVAYSFRDAYTGVCNEIADNTGKDTMVLVDVRVSSATTLSTEPVSAVRRSWQKL